MKKEKIEEHLFIEGEIWKDIIGYEGLYQVSDLGRVKSLARKGKLKEHIKACVPGTKGYLQCCLSKNGKNKTHRVHTLVANHFIPNPLKLPQINHLVSKTDNRACSLEWCTAQDNIIHAFEVLGRKSSMFGIFGKDHPGSIPVNQLDLDGNFIRRWDSASVAAREGGFNKSHIRECCLGICKSHAGFKWENAII